MKKKILYIEDELFMAKIVKETLEARGYTVLHQPGGATLSNDVATFNPDICLLDVMLPSIDGYALASHIRNVKPHLPIIFISAKTQTEDLVKGFAAGGTDYLRKPFSMEELLARIDNQLKIMGRDATVMESLPEVVNLKRIRFYPSRYELDTPEGCIKLSHRESQVLAILCGHINAATDRRDLLIAVWGDDSFFNSRNLDVYIKKLRGYFAGETGLEIVTLKGKGYQFVVA